MLIQIVLAAMRTILPLLLASCTAAQVVHWPIEKRQLPYQGLRRRATAGNTTTEIITNEKERGGYFATVSIGTPPQNLTLQLDTGSSDVWVPLNSAKVCVDTAIAGGCTFGSFTPDDSSTFEVVAEGLFDITFVDNSQAKGDYFEDRFTIGDVTLNNFTMGLAITSSIPYGLVGLGYSSNEAILDFVDQTYPNLPEALVDSGAINTIAYSLWLNDLSASTGSVLFGGIDTEKYVGNLTRINVLKEKSDPDPYHFEVALTSLIATSPSGSDILTSTSFPISAVLDSGTTLTYLPQDLAEQVWAEVGAVYDANEGGALIPCSFANNPGHFSFGFAGADGPQINVTMDELVLSSSEERGPPPTFESGAFKGQTSCAFGIQNYTDTPILLGDTFLRSAYVVYDLVNNEIGIAATDFNSTETNVIPFASSGAQIPHSTPAPNQDNLSQGSGSSNSNSSTQSAADGFKSSNNGQKDSDSPASHLRPGSVALTVAMALNLLGLL